MRAAPQVISSGFPRPAPTPRRSLPQLTSEARVVVSGPNLSDFDWAPAQGRQDQTLAQEVAPRVAERVRLGSHVRALCRGTGSQSAAIWMGKEVSTQATAAAAALAASLSPVAPQPRARPRGLEQEDGETRHRVRGEWGGASGHLPASPPGWERPLSQAILLLANAESGRCPYRATIGLCSNWAEPMPLCHWPAVKLGGAPAPATAPGWRESGGAALELRRGSHLFGQSLRGFPRLRVKGKQRTSLGCLLRAGGLASLVRATEE